MTPTTTISRWVLLAQTGDHQALARLFHEVEEELLRLLCRMIGDTHEAEDLLQEVFLVINRKLRWLRDPALFRTWAWRIATRAATRQIFRRRPARDVADDFRPEEVPAPMPAEEAHTPWRDRIPQLLGTLTPASRVVIVLHFLEGLSLEATADALELPLGTVKSRLAYGLARLREAVRATPPDDQRR